jgi:hypothetical protein
VIDFWPDDAGCATTLRSQKASPYVLDWRMDLLQFILENLTCIWFT